ncbi:MULTISPECIES: hypothetical protein [Pseudomonadati]|uniref:DUF1579 domain-containing protein n=1 Tax=Shewanella aestuarii TaxID=1028752 RepID=A0ABT0L4L6_9GAMM|nr:hypothetical protein [Shewanella aestuarii]MCL1118643.1 hypothetical protein [Shewanella aestuarii]GGN83516.1 hypothetical protein GCM10009193_31820 [Shewanella aestuarii]
MNINSVTEFCFSMLLRRSAMLLLASMAIVQQGHAIPLNTQLEAFYAKQAPVESNPLMGTWQLVSGKYLDEKQQWVDYQHLSLRSIKIISESHFSFTTIKDVQGSKQFWAAGTGTYQLTDKYYIETPDLNSFGVATGAAFKFEYTIKQDKLFTKRIENGVLKEQEVWQRI